jgi:hypothetical protein
VRQRGSSRMPMDLINNIVICRHEVEPVYVHLSCK